MCLECNSEALCRVCCLWSHCVRGKWTLQKVETVWDDTDSNREHFRAYTKFRDTQLMLIWQKRLCNVCSLRAIHTFFWHLWHLWHWVPTLTATQPTTQPPTLASPIQGDFLSKHTSAADCECELGWRGIWGDLADCAQASLFSRKSTCFKFPGPLMLLHPLICGHTKGNFISEGLNGTWKQTISSEC